MKKWDSAATPNNKKKKVKVKICHNVTSEKQYKYTQKLISFFMTISSENFVMQSEKYTQREVY